MSPKLQFFTRKRKRGVVLSAESPKARDAAGVDIGIGTPLPLAAVIDALVEVAAADDIWEGNPHVSEDVSGNAPTDFIASFEARGAGEVGGSSATKVASGTEVLDEEGVGVVKGGSGIDLDTVEEVVASEVVGSVGLAGVLGAGSLVGGVEINVVVAAEGVEEVGEIAGRDGIAVVVGVGEVSEGGDATGAAMEIDEVTEEGVVTDDISGVVLSGIAMGLDFGTPGSEKAGAIGATEDVDGFEGVVLMSPAVEDSGVGAAGGGVPDEIVGSPVAGGRVSELVLESSNVGSEAEPGKVEGTAAASDSVCSSAWTPYHFSDQEIHDILSRDDHPSLSSVAPVIWESFPYTFFESFLPILRASF